VSLGAVLGGARCEAPASPLTVAHLAERIAVGGWPGLLHMAPQDALHAVRDYMDEIRRVDIVRVDGIARDPDRVGRVLRALARSVGTPVTVGTLAADAGGADGTLARDTVSGYLSALERLMVIESQPAWAPRLRSRAILRGSPKRHFVDPSLAVAALRSTPDRLLADLTGLGFLFESLAVRDLRVYAQANDATVLQYRDNTGLEIDAIVEAANGRWAAFEVKLGSGQIDHAAAALLKFRGRVDQAAVGPPAALTVIVATGYAYQREDGVNVVPIGCLGP